MAGKEPVTELDARFSSDGATPTAWAQARRRLEEAEVYWLSTVRPDGRPHVTPLLSVWQDGALYFCTGPSERKARNLTQNPHCILTTGCNALAEGLDLVVEGAAARVSDDATVFGFGKGEYSQTRWRFDRP
jgi:nitroimidazol reductase NimA-like FMN-containing flavoprotein (pyridoxamine 5'-phosphate oxidase superfamily)